MPTLTLIKISGRPRKAIQQSVSYSFPPTAVLWNDSWLFTLLSHRFWCVYFTTLMQICQEVYFLFFPINFFKRDAKEWEGISGLVSEPCNSKAFGKLLKAFKKSHCLSEASLRFFWITQLPKYQELLWTLKCARNPFPFLRCVLANWHIFHFRQHAELLAFCTTAGDLFNRIK